MCFLKIKTIKIKNKRIKFIKKNWHFQTRDRVLTLETDSLSVCGLVGAVVKGDLETLVATCPVRDWKEAVVTVINHSQSQEQLSALLRELLLFFLFFFFGGLYFQENFIWKTSLGLTSTVIITFPVNSCYKIYVSKIVKKFWNRQKILK